MTFIARRIADVWMPERQVPIVIIVVIIIAIVTMTFIARRIAYSGVTWWQFSVTAAIMAIIAYRTSGRGVPCRKEAVVVTRIARS